MFWSSIGGGLSYLSYWEVWLCIVIYGVFQLVSMLIIGATQRDKASDREKASGIFLLTFILPIALGICLSALIAFMLPVLLTGHTASLREYSGIIGTIVWGGIWAAIASIVWASIPIIGDIMASNPCLATFAEGLIPLFLLLDSSLKMAGNQKQVDSNDFPNWLGTIGYAVIAFVLFFILSVFLIGVKFIVQQLMRRDKSEFYTEAEEGNDIYAILFSTFITSLGGFVTLLMYIFHIIK